ncbi:MocR-like pyridoxine biosynthesis transcription factor PdxR [Paenibacillus sedimenti]|uniref:PLP-dependent aminotransferase family protein n=1 Tax=Paenibacillus sedimenti TaxID=2770274 RepID=A0A926QHR8_9BACL|nr:PLP-dependent aminotransferase family protein [Paenibacillus sedimenti]MBD0378808.1 PLP-dependent aminotransferase family protein [Paenibacillus sedimenti]
MLWLPIDRSSDLTLTRQVYGQIRERILSGELASGAKLPSTRELSSELQVSRNIILEAYDQLLAEGFLAARSGSGTFVAEGTYLEQHKKAPLIEALPWDEQTNKGSHIINFRSGIPALDLFPRKTWAKLSQTMWNEAASSALGYDMPEGRPELRQVLSGYLLKTRGVYCHPEQLVITSGATQALTLAAKLLLSPGDDVIMEDPITHDIQTIFTRSGASIYPIPADQDGLDATLLPLHIQPRFVFTTPSHQYPLGGTLPIQRRVQLIKYARQKDCYLIEDDFDSEFRHEGPPVSSLQGLDPERVLYIGSFSKILSPGLRMGYLILPSQLVETCRKLKWFADLHTPSLNQLILARFIEGGYLERHIMKMKRIYKHRRDILIQCLKSAFAHRVHISGHSTGLHLIAQLLDVQFNAELLAEIREAGVNVYPVEDHTIEKGKHKDKLIIGYGHLTNEEIKEGVARLQQVLKSV